MEFMSGGGGGGGSSEIDSAGDGASAGGGGGGGGYFTSKLKRLSSAISSASSSLLETSSSSSLTSSTSSSSSSSASSSASSLAAQRAQYKSQPISEEQQRIFVSLGLNSNRISLRESLYKKFTELAGGEGEVTLERFVIDMLKKGHTAQWSDSAFRAFEAEQRFGVLNKYDFVLAVCTLRTDGDFLKNENWLSMRRRVVFSYYELRGEGKIDWTDFENFLKDISQTDEEPETFGISNKEWRGNLALNASQKTSENEDEMAQALAVTRVAYATKQSEFEELQLAYLKLEKQLCSLKLDLAAEKAKR